MRVLYVLLDLLTSEEKGSKREREREREHQKCYSELSGFLLDYSEINIQNNLLCALKTYGKEIF